MSKTKLIDPQEYGLEKKEVISIEKAFTPKITERKELEKIYKKVITKELGPEAYKEARELRLKLVKVRTGIAGVHKSQKAYFLAAGKFVDAWKNKETLPVTQMEEKLSEIENHEKIMEQKRLEALQLHRAEELSEYVDDAHERDLSSMDDDVWAAYLEAKKQAHKERIEAERIAEEKRIALEKAKQLHADRKEILLPYWNFLENEVKDTDFSQINEIDFNDLVETLKSEKLEHENEQKRIREENERLRLESEERAKKEAKERKEREEKERKEREAYETKLKAEREENERIQREEREKREKAEAELKAKKEAEQRAKKEAEEKIQAELNKGDSEKVKDLIGDLENLKLKYEFKSIKNKKMYAYISQQIEVLITNIKEY